MRATIRSGTRKAPIPAPFCSRAWPAPTARTPLQHGPPLQPDSVPIRVVTNPGYQPSTHGISYDVARNIQHVFLFTQSMVIKTRRPERPGSSDFSIEKSRRARFQLVDYFVKRPGAQLQHKMYVIRHHNPAEIPRICQAIWLIQIPTNDAGKRHYLKPGNALVSRRCYEVDTVFLRKSSRSQGAISRLADLSHAESLT